jgi:hypothetical protein
MTTNPDCAIKILRATTEIVRRLHPAIGASFGYIGNLDHRRDDRQWSVFTKLSSNPSPTACNVSWGRVATAALGALAVSATLGDVFEWADRQSIHLAAGKLYQVCPAGWLAQEIDYSANWPTRIRLAARR